MNSFSVSILLPQPSSTNGRCDLFVVSYAKLIIMRGFTRPRENVKTNKRIWIVLVDDIILETNRASFHIIISIASCDHPYCSSVAIHDLRTVSLNIHVRDAMNMQNPSLAIHRWWWWKLRMVRGILQLHRETFAGIVSTEYLPENWKIIRIILGIPWIQGVFQYPWLWGGDRQCKSICIRLNDFQPNCLAPEEASYNWPPQLSFYLPIVLIFFHPRVGDSRSS